MTRRCSPFWLAPLSVVLAGVALVAQSPPEPTPAKDEATLPVKKLAKAKKGAAKESPITINGRLTPKDAMDPARPGHFHQAHVQKLSARKTYIIELRWVASHWDVYLRLEDASGKQLAADDDSGGNNNARIVFTPPAEGAYKLIATSFSAGITGDYQLVIQPATLGTVPPPPGMPVVTMAPAEFGDIIITPLPLLGGTAVSGGGTDGTTHGYVEYRFQIDNQSETRGHQVTLTLPRWRSHMMFGHHLRTIQKTVEVAPQTSMQVSLLQPYLQLSSNNGVEVHIDGREAEPGGGLSINLLQARGPNQGRMYGSVTKHTAWGGQQYHILSPTDLLGHLSANAYRSAVGVPVDPALRGTGGVTEGKFSEPGHPHDGTMFAYKQANVFIPAAGGPSAWSANWLAYGAYDGVAVAGKELQTAPPEIRNALYRYVEAGGTLVLAGPCPVPEGWKGDALEKTAITYQAGLGRCVVFQDERPSSWSPDQWRHVTEMWERSGKTWVQVTTPTEAHRAFPVVEHLGIPVRGLFLFMFAFVILIGPVNIYWLARTNRRIWLLWTVPVFSLLTSGLLFAYMAVTEGVRAHFRASVLTVLDENTQRAASIGWMGYYSPTTPGDGLHFPYDTEISPHLTGEFSYRRDGRYPATLNWTNDQHFESGWLTAKVPAHFLVRRNEKRLERLLTRRGGERITIVNGLKAELASLTLADKDGKLWTASDVRAGAEVTLQPLDAKLAARPLGMDTLFSEGWLAAMRRLEKTPTDYLRPGSYFAVVEDLPFIEAGLRSTQSLNVRSLVYGVLKEAP